MTCTEKPASNLYPDAASAFSANLARLRKEKGASLNRLAHFAGISRQCLQLHERGSGCHFETAVRIAAVLDVEVMALLAGWSPNVRKYEPSARTFVSHPHTKRCPECGLLFEPEVKARARQVTCSRDCRSRRRSALAKRRWASGTVRGRFTSSSAEALDA